MFKKIYYLKIFFLLALLFFTYTKEVLGLILIPPRTLPASVAPNGSTAVVLIINPSMPLDSETTETISSLQLFNNGPVAFGPNGVTKISIYKDLYGDGLIGNEDPLLGSSICTLYSQFQIVTMISPPVISSTNTTQLLISYTFANSVPLSATSNATIYKISVTNGNGLDFSGYDTSNQYMENPNIPTTNTIRISGIAQNTITTKNPSFVLPGEKNVPMLHLEIQTAEESIDSFSDLSLVFKNDGNNFNTGENGVSKATLYKTSFNADAIISNTTFNTNYSSIISDVPNGSFTNSNTLNFKFPPYTGGFTGISNTESTKFYLTYDIGLNISVTENNFVQANFLNLEGMGRISKLKLLWPSVNMTSVIAPQVPVGGLAIASLENIIPNNTFGSDNQIPMLKIKLRSNYTAVTLNSIVIQNTKAIPFATTIGGNGIKNIEIFMDRDQNGVFSKEDDEPAIASINLGEKINNIAINTGSVATLYFNPRNQDPGLTIDTYDSNMKLNEKTLFVIYSIGNFSPSGANDIEASIGELNVSLNTTSVQNGGEVIEPKLIKLNTFQTLQSTPAAILTLQQTNLSIKDAKYIYPESATRGSIKVPALSIRILANQPIQNTRLTFLSNNGVFLSNNNGISKIWLYKDSNENNILDNEDEFKSATSVFTDKKTAQLLGVNLETDNHFLVLFDIGQNAFISDRSIGVQLSAINGTTGGGLLAGGQIPIPNSPKFLNTVDTPLLQSIITVDSDPSYKKIDTTRNIRIKVSNKTSNTLNLLEVKPIFYHNTISGSDISYEFSIISQNTSFSLEPLSSRFFEFSVKHRNKKSSGSVIVDSYVKFETLNSNIGIQSRYIGDSSWISATESPLSFYLSENPSYSWEYPAYIKKVEVIKNDIPYLFYNGNALDNSDSIRVTFESSGIHIDESSLSLNLNGSPMTLSKSEMPFTYDYDRQTGTINFLNLGNKNGTLTLNVTDTAGVSLPETKITFLKSEYGQIDSPLFYPNPYVMGKSNLKLGFNLSKVIKIKYYIYNQLGVQVKQGELENPKVGYNIITFSAFEDFLSPGMFICILIGEDGSQKISKTTKLAIY